MADTPRLTPPGADQTTPNLNRTARPLWFGLSLGILVLLGVAVIMILPGLVPREAALPQSAPPALEPQPAAIGKLKQKQAEGLLAELLHRRAELETDSVSIWGQSDYLKILELVSAGDTALEKGQFDPAIEIYQQVLRDFEQLTESKPRRMSAAMGAARTALAQTDGKAAATQFRIALALDPDNQEAQAGLQRAATIDQAAALVSKGEAEEAKAQWQAAQATYAEAANLDPLFQPAQAGIERVSEKIREQNFRAAMSDLLNALDQGAFAKAEDALARARAEDPQAPALKDAAQQLAMAKRNSRLRSLRRRAAGKEAEEDWAAAAGLFRNALKLDPTAAFARKGLRRAEERLELQRKLDHYINQPGRLQDRQTLTNAKALVTAIRNLPEAGPKLRGERDSLAHLIAMAEQPVAVRVYSDNNTDVVIYHVGRLGRFEKRELTLRPGTYTMVGSRDGYRDVRKVFTLRPGDRSTDIVIRCEERI